MAHVLVVDDEPDIRALVALNLRIDGHHVSTAIDGEQALTTAAALRPELIVLDLMMPGRDGFSVLESLKADTTGLASVPVVLLTARSDRMDRIRGGIEGAVVYLTKPFSVSSLRQTVAAVLDEGDEPGLRLRAQRNALADLARVESGTEAGTSVARPRLTRLEPQGPPPPRPVSEAPIDRSQWSVRQLKIGEVVATAPSLTAAAITLGVSRTYVYAALRHMAEKAGVESGPEVARLLRSLDESTRA